MAKIHQLGGRIFNRKLSEYRIEINKAQGRIMFVLWQEDGIPIARLAKETSLGKSTLTSMLDRLEKSGYIYREPSLSDRRQILIYRTRKDKSFQKKYEEISEEMGQLYFDGFSNQEISQFDSYLQRILRNLQRDTE